MEAGELALIILAAITIASIGTGCLVTAYQLIPSKSTLQSRLQIFAITTGTVALSFWIWALVNTIRTNFDAGVISFPFPFAAAIAAFVRPPEEARRNMKSEIIRYGVPSLLPFANYVFGAYVVSTRAIGGPLLVVYMIVGAVWWLAASSIGILLVTQGTRGPLGERETLASGGTSPASEAPLHM